MVKTVTVSAPATVANVACGFDVLGLALPHPADEVTMQVNRSGNVVIRNIEGAELPLEASQNVCGVALHAFMKAYGDTSLGFELSLKKGIAPGSGIGSSAASSAAAVVAANVLLGEPFTKTQLVSFAMEGERLASGSAHADNVAPAILGGVTLVRSTSPLDVIALHVPADLWVAVVHPQVEVKTSDARSVLHKKVLLSDAVQQWGNVGSLVAALYREDFDLLGRSLQDVIVEPLRSILIPYYAKLKSVCIASGALGGGISGSGPSVFMLCKGAQNASSVAEAMKQVFDGTGISAHVYHGKVNVNGASVLE